LLKKGDMSDDIVIRRATLSDVDVIMAVLDSARRFMRSCGNVSQWGNGYPSRECVSADITSGNCYVGVDCEGDVVMTFAFIIGDDPTYALIEDGAWLNDSRYGTIHRMGSTGKYGGMLRRCVEFCMQYVDNLRLDTHEDNRPMLSAVSRLGFRRCGIIYCQDGTPRIAFHKVR